MDTKISDSPVDRVQCQSRRNRRDTVETSFWYPRQTEPNTRLRRFKWFHAVKTTRATQKYRNRNWGNCFYSYLLVQFIRFLQVTFKLSIPCQFWNRLLVRLIIRFSVFVIEPSASPFQNKVLFFVIFLSFLFLSLSPPSIPHPPPWSIPFLFNLLPPPHPHTWLFHPIFLLLSIPSRLSLINPFPPT